MRATWQVARDAWHHLGVSWASLQKTTLDDRPVVIKRTDYDARLEADGLRALAAAGAPVPEVFEAEQDHLTMRWVEGEPQWESLGRALARVHDTAAEQFGYPVDNVIGSLPQINSWTSSWGEFFAHHRVRDHLEDPAVPTELGWRLSRAAEGPLIELLDEHSPSPGLVHGDLWAGNVVDGAWLIDPAVSYSDREVELAFMALFGGIPDTMWSAYLEMRPLDEGWERRRLALQLHHLLVHVRLFGRGYIRLVAERLDRLGW